MVTMILFAHCWPILVEMKCIASHLMATGDRYLNKYLQNKWAVHDLVPAELHMLSYNCDVCLHCPCGSTCVINVGRWANTNIYMA